MLRQLSIRLSQLERFVEFESDCTIAILNQRELPSLGIGDRVTRIDDCEVSHLSELSRAVQSIRQRQKSNNKSQQPGDNNDDNDVEVTLEYIRADSPSSMTQSRSPPHQPTPAHSTSTTTTNTTHYSNTTPSHHSSEPPTSAVQITTTATGSSGSSVHTTTLCDATSILSIGPGENSISSPPQLIADPHHQKHQKQKEEEEQKAEDDFARSVELNGVVCPMPPKNTPPQRTAPRSQDNNNDDDDNDGSKNNNTNTNGEHVLNNFLGSSANHQQFVFTGVINSDELSPMTRSRELTDAERAALNNFAKSQNNNSSVQQQLQHGGGGGGGNEEGGAMHPILNVANEDPTAADGPSMSLSGASTSSNLATFSRILGEGSINNNINRGGRDAPIEDDHSCFTLSSRSQSSDLRPSLEKALSRVQLGHCIILITNGNLINPTAEIEALATSMGVEKSPTILDFGVKMRFRPNAAAFAQIVRHALTEGEWLVVMRASKCIYLLDDLAVMLDECRKKNLRGVHANARIILITEPHPHFPAILAMNAPTLTVLPDENQQSQFLFSSLSRTSAKLGAIRDLGNENAQAESGPDGGMPAPSTAATSSSSGAGAKVKIACAVTVVEIEARRVFDFEGFEEASRRGGVSLTDSPPTANTENHGSLSLCHTTSAMKGDKFFCVNSAGHRRFAIGSSLGNVYVVDHRGASLLSTHVHDACVWDVHFSSEQTFSTGCEDNTAVSWRISHDNTVARTSCTRCSADVYCAKFGGPDKTILGIGGLMQKFTLRSTTSKATVNLSLEASCQALQPLGDHQFVLGTGNGSIMTIDLTTSAIGMNWHKVHDKKIPCLATENNTIVTGSFDGGVSLWDARLDAGSPTHKIRLKHYVTGVDLDSNYLAASAGESLYLWDVRKVDQVLGGCAKAWSGLSRGIKVDGTDETIVTASPDGLIRYWSF